MSEEKKQSFTKEYYENKIKREVRNKAVELSAECVKMANLLPAVKCVNNSKKVVFDTETTGLSEAYDEILQISIIDGEGNELINSYVKPYWNDSWEEAQAIHGITEEMVKNAPYIHELIPRLKGIFDSAELIIAYNNSFDIGFIKRTGIDLSEKHQYDVMKEFAPYFGEWSNEYSTFKWQKLVNAARYFDYEFKAHDALEDIRATLHCYNELTSLQKSGKYDEMVKKNYEMVNKMFNKSNDEKEKNITKRITNISQGGRKR